MKHEFACEEAQRQLKQRNRFAALAGLLGLTTVLAVGAAATRDETLVLVPITSERIALSSDGIEAHYLELVTRERADTSRPNWSRLSTSSGARKSARLSSSPRCTSIPRR